MSQPRVPVLIVATTPWSIAARVAARLVQHGCEVFALCPRGHPLNHVSGLRLSYWRASRNTTAQLGVVISEVSPCIVVPCDDRAVWQLHELYEQEQSCRSLIELSIGSSRHFPSVRSRNKLIEIARSLGLLVPETQLIAEPQQIRSWFEKTPGPAVMKFDGTWGGGGVEFVRSAEEGVATWHTFRRSQPLSLAWKRLLINRDPLAFWRGPESLGRAVSMQTFIPGELANTMVACWRGQVLGAVSVRVLCTQHPRGASTVIQLCKHEEMTRAAVRLAGELELSGFFGLDYVMEAGTGRAHLIELNARCTQLGHLILPEQGDLIGMLCAKLGASGGAESHIPIAGDTIALFPQALAWNPDSSYLATCHHDIPWTEPALVRELMRDSWAERQLVARVYHRLRGRKRNPVPSMPGFLQVASASGWPNFFRDVSSRRRSG